MNKFKKSTVFLVWLVCPKICIAFRGNGKIKKMIKIKIKKSKGRHQTSNMFHSENITLPLFHIKIGLMKYFALSKNEIFMFITKVFLVPSKVNFMRTHLQNLKLDNIFLIPNSMV